VKKDALKPRMIASAYPFSTAKVAIYIAHYYLINITTASDITISLIYLTLYASRTVKKE
jgi:hypothetical protein